MNNRIAATDRSCPDKADPRRGPILNMILTLDTNAIFLGPNTNCNSENLQFRRGEDLEGYHAKHWIPWPSSLCAHPRLLICGPKTTRHHPVGCQRAGELMGPPWETMAVWVSFHNRAVDGWPESTIHMQAHRVSHDPRLLRATGQAASHCGFLTPGIRFSRHTSTRLN
ncbi:hypothetical protein RRG08_047135 [Elysia crispata]|uniref:Uncharacterized protein n=1 Tax=Elysia crispata TaxID=231223 RepID=A0AAE1ANR8_9GAST|nr:hypothetical protein RRG08_047135 [Elysia crispata]